MKLTRKSRLWIAGIIIFIIVLVASFPAALAVRWFVPPGAGLAFGTVDGTVWSGRINSLQHRELKIASVRWSWHPFALLTGRIGSDIEVEFRGHSLRGEISRSFSGTTRLESLQGSLPLSLLEKLRMIPANSVREGALILNLESLTLESSGLAEFRLTAAEGRVAVTGLATSFMNTPLGDYEADLQTGSNSIVAAFRELDAPLRLHGSAELTPDGRYLVKGSIASRGDSPDMLVQALSMLGPPNDAGEREFEFSGKY